MENTFLRDNRKIKNKNELKKYQEEETQRLRKIDYLQFQIKEIQKVQTKIERK